MNARELQKQGRRLQKELANVAGFRRRRIGDDVNDLVLLLTGAIIGGFAMYILDAESGRRRRALARDKAIWALNRLERYGRGKAKDLRNRAMGTLHELRSGNTRTGERQTA